jgi:transposase
MRPAPWHPPVPASAAEQAILARIKHARLFIFLRQQRHRLFTDAFQAELALLYRDSRRGQPPVPPAQLALATILQAYTGVSDDEAIELTTMDRRWQVVLDCLDATAPPFSKGTLVAFRQRLIAHDLDRRLIERTVEMAATSGLFGSRALRVALDASPLWGAGRVEDTYNLIGHALRKALRVIARQQGRELAAVAAEAGAGIVAGSSLKAALDRDWDDPQARGDALAVVLAALDAVEAWLDGAPCAPPITASMARATRVREQDVEQAGDGTPALRRGVSKERLISIEDPQMRHGRKSKTHLFNGYKRHVLRDLDSGLVRAVGVTPANEPEAMATDAVLADLDRQAVRLSEVHIDRGYLSSALVRQRPPELAIYCKAWAVHNGGRFSKTAFVLDWERREISCPAGVVRAFVPGGTVHFPAATCAVCPLHTECTTSSHGRSVTIHPDERLLTELRTRQQTPAGRAKLRERIAVEHTLAQVGRWQGDRARYRGARKNLFDLRRTAVVHNLHVIARTSPAEQMAA